MHDLKIFTRLLLLGSVLLSACGPAATPTPVVVKETVQVKRDCQRQRNRPGDANC